MATDFPGAIDSFSTKTDEVTDVMAADVNDLQDAVEAIETELGSDPAGTAADVKTRLAQSLDSLGNLDFKAIGALTISGGSVTPTQNWHTVDTEGSAASDDLDTIAATNVTDGFVLFLRQANDARDVTLKHGTGNISCPGGVDIALADTTQVVMLIYDGTLTKWLASICPSNVALTNKANTWAAEQILTKSERHAYTSISTNTTLDATQNVVDVDVTSASVAITLPTAVGINGREYVIRKLDSSANTVTITPNGSETVNGSSDIVLDEQYESTIIYSDGANWIQLATGGGGGASSDLIEHTHTGSTDGGLLRLDTIAAPTDTTANDVSISAHGLFPKLPGTSDTYWNGKGEWATISGGSASSDLIEHGHTGAADGGALKLDDLQPPDDTTDLDASTDAHGLLPKLPGISTQYFSGAGSWGSLTSHAGNFAVPGGAGGLVRLVNSSVVIAGTTDANSAFEAISVDNLFALMRSGTTDFDASTDTHGFLPMLSGTSDNFLNGKGEWGTSPYATTDGAVVMATSPSTDYITKFISATNIGNSLLFDNGTNVGLGHAVPTGRLDIQGLAVNDLPTYSAEFLDDANWTLGAGWSGDFATGFVHASGTATLTHDHAAVSTTKYQIAYTVTGRTAGSFTVAFGGQSLAAITATGAWGPTATNTDALTITPTTDFNGTIVISIKSITAVSTALINLRNSAGTVVNEIRSGNSNASIFIGVNSGRYNTTNLPNIGIGLNTLSNNTTGAYNVSIGQDSLSSNTVGTYNTSLGYNSLNANISGVQNVSVGQHALSSNTTGAQNTVVGAAGLLSNILGSRNSGIGFNSLTNTVSSYNSAFGANSGRSNTTGTYNTFLGHEAGYNASQKVDATNSMALGNGAYTTADNQVVIGNTSVTSTILHGSVTLDDAANLVLGTTTGTKIGTAANQKIGFFNVTPVVQRSHIEDATDATNVITRFNSLLLALEQLGLLASS